TDLKLGAVFPTDHPLHAGAPAVWLDGDASAALKQADIVLSLDWVDLGGTLKRVFGGQEPPPRIIHASLDHRLHGGWSMAYQALPHVVLLLAADPDLVVDALLDALQVRPATSKALGRRFAADAVLPGALSVRQVAHGLRHAADGRDVSL